MHVDDIINYMLSLSPQERARFALQAVPMDAEDALRLMLGANNNYYHKEWTKRPYWMDLLEMDGFMAFEEPLQRHYPTYPTGATLRSVASRFATVYKQDILANQTLAAEVMRWRDG